jgi:hypothetical protein
MVTGTGLTTIVPVAVLAEKAPLASKSMTSM